jgi:hypothetical protein
MVNADEVNPANNDLFAGFANNQRPAKPILLLLVLLYVAG